MPLLSRPERNPAVADHRQATGHRQRVMASASGPRVRLLALADHFAVQYLDQPWQCIGWHEVRTGGWRHEAEEMHWRLVDGRRDSYHLDAEGRFPEVFRERVQASVALDAAQDAPGRGRIQISARRDLSGANPQLIWHVDAVGGASMDDPATAEAASQALARLRQDYDL